MNAEESATAISEPTWTKSSYSGGEGGNCVEVADCRCAVHVRDSKDAEGAMLSFGAGQWDAFLRFAAKE